MRAFISYSHDSEEHTNWVLLLAEKVQRFGVTVTLDRWDLCFGQDVNRFMEESISSSDIVFVVCTPNYVLKSNGRRGGVGYESVILSSELARNQDSRKFVPIVRNRADGVPLLPIFLGARLYVDMTQGDGFGHDFQKLARQISSHVAVQSSIDVPVTSVQDSPSLVIDGPAWFEGNPAQAGPILDILGANDVGLINVDLEEIHALFGDAGFWYGSTWTRGTSVAYNELAAHATLNVHHHCAAATVPLRSICIVISGPAETLKLRDANVVLENFRKIIPDDAHVIATVLLRKAGERISYAFA